jgi:hypothetical protein
MKIFVLGGTGVIGSRVVPRLRSLGHEVTLFPWRVPSFGFAGHDAVINLATHIPPASRALLPGAWRATNRLRRTLPPILAKSGIPRWIATTAASPTPRRRLRPSQEPASCCASATSMAATATSRSR